MMRGEPSSFELISRLLCFPFVVSAATARLPRDDCSSSSCGEIQSIRYPFRLKDDPDGCGDPNHELICRGNKTILEVFSGTYHVTDISYGDAQFFSVVDDNSASDKCITIARLASPRAATVGSSNNYKMPNACAMATRVNVVDVNLASGKCVVPSLSVSPSYLVSEYYKTPELCWFAFLNCSEKITDNYDYTLVPCLNGNMSNGFVYVTSNGCSAVRVESLAPSCTFLSMVPRAATAEGSDAHIFQQLQKGFMLVPKTGKDLRVDDIIFLALDDAIEDASRERGFKIFKINILFPFSVEINIVRRLYYYQGKNENFRAALVVTSVLIAFTNIAMFVIVFGALSRFILAPMSIFVFLCHQFWKMRVPMDKIEKFLRFQQNLEPTRYSYPDIVAMTCNFKVKLGQGGFGSVFRGDLPGGYPVAVKMLGNTKFNGDDFISEVSTIGRIHHLNVVRLVGFCSEGSKRALVYEFMPNGSLDKYIFTSNGADRYFTMEKLNEIALGVARGIDYLHRGCDMRILHFDIKPQNILLDQNFNPKVSDFGLARLYPKDYSIVTVSAARGTIGYIAPELVSRCFGAVSNKSDVYSFGMLLMEMAGARRNFDRRVENSSQCYYPSWIYDRLQQAEESEEVQICSAAIEIDDMERKLCKVGLWCIQTKASDRPSMSKVVELLEADTDTLALPPKPFLSSSHTISITRQSDMESSDLTELSIISEE